MMTRAFKVFLLMLLLFAAFWAYRFRSRDLQALMELGTAPPADMSELAGLRSPVPGVLDPRDASALAILYLRNPLLEPARKVQSFADPGILDGGEAEESVYLDPEEEAAQEIIFRDEPVRESRDLSKNGGRDKESRPAPEKTQLKEKGKDSGKEASKAKAAPKDKASENGAEKGSAQKPAGLKAERPKADKSKAPAPRPDPRIVPADGSRPGREQPTAVAKAPPAEPSKPMFSLYVVKEGETLAKIARRYYRNDPEQWKAIYAANQERIADPDALSPGTELRIPKSNDRRSDDASTKSAMRPPAKGGSGRAAAKS